MLGYDSLPDTEEIWGLQLPWGEMPPIDAWAASQQRIGETTLLPRGGIGAMTLCGSGKGSESFVAKTDY